ncbi:hypothetical protein C791_3986 [Amycolatopsis azurea DSM 43854]|uniref:Uncharacterized protein n=1 Tax=Amycolatopsis azurea DSM 43854 TaxID=1238180 RepID=M2NU78_9PSEU|nr:hypothetical protein C791_3986 [Amycolatopsis azurea DSM 43854]
MKSTVDRPEIDFAGPSTVELSGPFGRSGACCPEWPGKLRIRDYFE